MSKLRAVPAVILGRVTNVSVGTEIVNVTGFGGLVPSGDDAPTAISPPD